MTEEKEITINALNAYIMAIGVIVGLMVGYAVIEFADSILFIMYNGLSVDVLISQIPQMLLSNVLIGFAIVIALFVRKVVSLYR